MITDLTYRSLRDFLNSLPENSPHLDQPVQFCENHPCEDHVYPLQPAITLGTVDELELKYVRSSVDNRRHGDELVFFCDYNPHGENGATAYEWDVEDTDNLIDNNIFSKDKPIFPKGHDDSADWTGPAQKLVDEQWVESDSEFDAKTISVLKHRLEDYDNHRKE